MDTTLSGPDLLPVLDLPPIHPVSDSPACKFWGDGFEIETLINVRVARAGVRIAEVGSTQTRPRLHGVSNLRAIPDGVRVLRTILAERRRTQSSQPARRREPVIPGGGEG